MKIKNDIIPKNLTKLGFISKEWYDKNGVNDKEYNLKFIQYNKKLNNEASIEITYGYYLLENKEELIEISYELTMDCSYTDINVNSIEDLKAFMNYFKNK